MILGYQFSVPSLIVTGTLLFAVLVFQVLVGKRVIRFKGRTHANVHKCLGYWVLVGGALHGLLALAVYAGWRILG